MHATTLAATLAALSDTVTSIVESLGYIGVLLLVVAENVFPPIPSELILPFAGFWAGQGNASLVGMVAASTAGSVIGALVLYQVAAKIGSQRLHRLVERHGRWFGARSSDLVRAEAWFEKRSVAAVTLGRCVPLIRSLVSLPAGLGRMRLLPFCIGTAIGSLAWNVALIGAGAVLGEHWDRVSGWVGKYQTAVLGAGVVAVAVIVVGLLARRRREEV